MGAGLSVVVDRRCRGAAACGDRARR